MKRPFLAIALAYAAGSVAASRLPLPLSVLFGAAFASAALTFLIARWREPLLLALCFLMGNVHLVLRTSVVSRLDLRRIAGTSPTLASVRGRVMVSPWLRLVERPGQTNARTLLVLQVDSLQLKGKWQPASGQLLLSVRGNLKEPGFVGLVTQATGVLREPPAALADGLFDYRQYLYWQGIYHQLVIDDPAELRFLPGETINPRPALADRFLAWAQQVLAMGLPEEDESLRLLWAMTLGWKTAMTAEVSAPFMRTGTLHVFAISGMHIVLSIRPNIEKPVKPRVLGGFLEKSSGEDGFGSITEAVCYRQDSWFSLTGTRAVRTCHVNG